MNEEVLVKTYNIDNKDYVVVNELDIKIIHIWESDIRKTKNVVIFDLIKKIKDKF